MATNHYQIYIENTIALAETLVIKSSESAEMMNTEVVARYGQDSVIGNQPQTWKYYKNICGEYHFTDKMIQVTSLDTLETIEFTKENLKNHKATEKAYQYGTRYYRELVNEHPLSEMLILGVLYPADMDKAIQATDGDVLAYPPHLVEDNETSLIFNIEKWLKDYRARWYNVQFGMSDSLYLATHLGIMYLQLVPLILNLRLAACKTDEVHSFHIRQYLGSHGFLDEYLDVMNQKQALFFYRNIAYIERNAGSKDTFEWLIDNVLTERGIPVVSYDMRHNLRTLMDDIRPTPVFTRTPLNQQINTDTSRQYTLREILDKQRNKTKGNPDYIKSYTTDIEKELKLSLSDKLNTKVIESTVIDYTDATQFTLEDILLNHWIWFTYKDIYKTYINVKNPITGKTIALNVKDAFIYYLYCWVKSIGITPTTVPSFPAIRVRRIPKPIEDDLRSVADEKSVSTDYIHNLLLRQPEIKPIISTESFYSFCTQLYHEAQLQRREVSDCEHYHKRGLLENTINRLYCDVVCTMYPGDVEYTDWLNERELPYTEFKQEEFTLLADDILDKALGLSLNNTISLNNLQKSMISLMEKLSSYSIQFVNKINASNIKLLNWAAIRLGDIDTESRFYKTVNQNNIRVDSTSSKAASEFDIDVNYSTVRTSSIDKFKHKADYAIKVKAKYATNGDYSNEYELMVGPMNISAYSPLDSAEHMAKNGIVGYYTFDGLDDQKRSRLRSVYRACFGKVSGVLSDLTLILQTDRLTSFKHMNLYENHYKHFHYTGALGDTWAYTIMTEDLESIDTGVWLIPTDMVRRFSDEAEVMSLSIYKQHGLVDMG